MAKNVRTVPNVNRKEHTAQSETRKIQKSEPNPRDTPSSHKSKIKFRWHSSKNKRTCISEFSFFLGPLLRAFFCFAVVQRANHEREQNFKILLDARAHTDQKRNPREKSKNFFETSTKQQITRRFGVTPKRKRGKKNCEVRVQISQKTKQNRTSLTKTSSID